MPTKEEFMDIHKSTQLGSKIFKFIKISQDLSIFKNKVNRSIIFHFKLRTNKCYTRSTINTFFIPNGKDTNILHRL